VFIYIGFVPWIFEYKTHKLPGAARLSEYDKPSNLRTSLFVKFIKALMYLYLLYILLIEFGRPEGKFCGIPRRTAFPICMPYIPTY
jgi:hypothetical protein